MIPKDTPSPKATLPLRASEVPLSACENHFLLALNASVQQGCPEFSIGSFLKEVYLRFSILPNKSHNDTYEVVKAVQ